jgi:hypothetical protein
MIISLPTLSIDVMILPNYYSILSWALGCTFNISESNRGIMKKIVNRLCCLMNGVYLCLVIFACCVFFIKHDIDVEILVIGVLFAGIPLLATLLISISLPHALFPQSFLFLGSTVYVIFFLYIFSIATKIHLGCYSSPFSVFTVCQYFLRFGLFQYLYHRSRLLIIAQKIMKIIPSVHEVVCCEKGIVNSV